MYNHKRNHGLMPHRVNGVFENLINGDWNKMFYDDNWSNVTAPVNIKETEKTYEIDVIAPGLNKENFKIEVDKDTLNISFEQSSEKEENTDKVLRNEYHFRSFKRSFTLNEKVNSADINAKYVDGVLKVTLPKKENVDTGVRTVSVS